MSEPEETETKKILRIVDKLAISTERGFRELRAELGADINGVRNELRADINGVRSELGAEIKSVRSELGAEIRGVRNELGAEIRGVRNEVVQLRLDMNRRFDRVDERFDELAGRVTALERTSHTHPEA